MSLDARSVANYLLDRADDRGIPLTNLALNKILYFCHAWHLAKFGQPLLATRFEAWDHGPVVPSVYHQFKGNKERPINNRAMRIDLENGKDVVASTRIQVELAEFLESMLGFYGPRPGSVLRNMSHEPGAPWDVVRESGGAGMFIPDSLIAEYFSERLKARNN